MCCLLPVWQLYFSCPKAGDMTKHSFTHTGEKPFQCGICDYSYNCAETVKEHMESHKSNDHTPLNFEVTDALVESKPTEETEVVYCIKQDPANPVNESQDIEEGEIIGEPLVLF